MSDVTYKIRVNRPCYLYIDGEQVAFLREMQLEKITLPQGRYIRRVVALDNESIYDEKVITISSFVDLDIIDLSTMGLLNAKRRALPSDEFRVDGLKYKAMDNECALRVVGIDHWYWDMFGNLNELVIPSSIMHNGYKYDVLEVVGDFYNCTFSSLILSNGIRRIGVGTFGCCYSLSSVTIPNSMIEIERCAFQDCMSLKSINFLGTFQELRRIDPKFQWTYSTAIKTMHCIDGDY